MRILIVTPLLPPEPGGPSYYAVHLKDELLVQGHKVETVAFREVRKYPSGIRHLLLFFKILRRTWGTDGMIVLDTVSVALPAVFAGCILRKKIILRVGGDFVWERYIERTGESVLLSEFYKKKIQLTKKEKFLIYLQKNIIFPLATKIVFNTDWQRHVWYMPYGIDVSKSTVIANAFQRKDGKHAGDKCTFLFCGRDIILKNKRGLSSAFKIVQKNYSQTNLEVLENVPQEVFFEKIKKVHALVVPSVSEVNPNIVFEALSMGLPVLLTKDCGAKDILGDSVTWIDPLDPEDIAQKMQELMNEENYKKAKEKAQTFSYTHSYIDIAEEFVSLLK